MASAHQPHVHLVTDFGAGIVCDAPADLLNQRPAPALPWSTLRERIGATTQ